VTVKIWKRECTLSRFKVEIQLRTFFSPGGDVEVSFMIKQKKEEIENRGKNLFLLLGEVWALEES
jgi:hypothetical protein